MDQYLRAPLLEVRKAEVRRARHCHVPPGVPQGEREPMTVIALRRLVLYS
jgi:hypothetical protein